MRNKLFLTLGIVLISFVFLFGAKTVLGCGGGVQCHCGDTVDASTGPNDITDMDCSGIAGSALIVSSPGITINGYGHTIIGSFSGLGIGVDIQATASSGNPVVVTNLTITKSTYGIRIYNGSSYVNVNHVLLKNNSNAIAVGWWGDGCSHNTIDNNIIDNNQFGIVFDPTAENFPSENNTFTNNTVLNNEFDVVTLIVDYNAGVGTSPTIGETNNIFYSNKFINNLKSAMISFTDSISRVKSVSSSISYGFSMLNLSNTSCSGCTPTVTTNPSETLSKNIVGNQVTGSFTPHKTGTYSLNFSVADSNGNTTERRLVFLATNNPATQTTKYYMRDLLPIHGQSADILGFDTKTMFYSQAPQSRETWYCDIWTQSSPDEIPSYPLSYITDVNAGLWYQGPNSIALQRAETYDTYNDLSIEVSGEHSNPIPSNYSKSLDGLYYWGDGSEGIDFQNVNWAMDNPTNWYWIALKPFNGGPKIYGVSTPTADEADPTSWASHSNDKSYVNFTYSYANTPAVKSISNTDVNILSATADPSALSNVSLTLENSLSTTQSADIVLDKWNTNILRPFINATKTIIDPANSTATVTASVLANTTSNLTSIPLDITPTAGTVSVSGITWNTGTGGNYSKSWTETGDTSAHSATANHTIGDLQPNASYVVKVDGSTIGSVQRANSSGQISFNYTGGYSSHDFLVTTPSSADQILSFAIPNQSGSTTINQSNHTITLTMPYGTIPTALTPTITLSSGATVSPASGTATNFTNSATYTVTAEDGSTQQSYTVTVNIAKSSSNNITAFNFPQGLNSNITGTNISVTVSYGTSLANLVANFTTTGSLVEIGSITQISGTTPNDFTNPVIYTVVAEDNSTKQYTITVTVAPAPPVVVNGGGGGGGAIAYLNVLKSVVTQTPVIQQPTQPPQTPLLFTKVLQLGDVNPDVKRLQQFLNTHGFVIVKTGAGSLGHETQKFGLATKQALIKFQEANAKDILTPSGLTKGTGKFARATINFVDAMLLAGK